ncbi:MULTISPECIES: hypothetical protein [Mycobacteroides]|uniref:hypothetical protein n=1 Tax=Mycobacteroides TaxID=670516 RepID=UPI0008A8C48D|nr:MULTISPECIES: hypothetical protein [Mycobacteroides]AYM40333.1 hypothetical protein DYE20_01115 [[Mycobacterium] chelonae subsp. gwanakae]OHU15917.1 hypothetical protein BKG75_12780 [Mycobacteroides chelonae]SIF25844.1 Uncharacterised protein [Mycobacteroides abscessus subsp. abscessus]SIF38987.1 Uncharacterised protein [Mycobacteroides abscessus subsp. abscessus]SIF83321.1 Uncharacterised protein [Mycobacteroides abscessus subsp. abscessus]
MTTPTTAHTTVPPLVAAADTVTTTYADALAPLMRLAARSVEHPPTVEAGLAAVAHLCTAAATEIDRVMRLMLIELHGSGVKLPKLARLLGVRKGLLEKKLFNFDTWPTAAAAAEIGPGAYTHRDKVSTRCARESLIAAAGNVGVAYADALRPLSRLSQGGVPTAATVDAALEAVVHLHRSRTALDAALDPVLAALVLGGVKRKALAEVLDCHAHTLQRRLLDQPLAHARHVDLVNGGDGTWSVERAAVGRYAAVDDDFDIEAAMADAVTGYTH